MIASHRASRKSAIGSGGPAITLISRGRPVAPPDAPIPRKLRQKYCWAGAATPTQPNTNRPQEQPRRADDVFNGTNMLRKDNPRWPISNALETKTVPDAVLMGCGIVVAWLIGLPRRAGRHLFVMNDQEARWHHWQVTETHGGLGRQYRALRFDAFTADSALRRDEITGEAILPGADGHTLSAERL
jgi:hypothetical protein